MKITHLALATALLGSSAVLADPARPMPIPQPAGDSAKAAKLTASDLATMAHVHAVNQMEIEMGKLAQKTGASAGVKAYGGTLVQDHTAADKELLALAKKRGAVLPKDKPASDAEKQQQKDDMDEMTKLRSAKGAEFDRRFLALMIAGHEREIAKLDTAIGATSDDELGAWLKGIKPTLQAHATTARDLQNNAPQATK